MEWEIVKSSVLFLGSMVDNLLITYKE